MAPSSEDSNPRPKKRTKYDFFQDITVLIGPEETKFVVHKDVVTKHSEFFKAACSGNWKEASEGLVRLPEADLHAFGVYIGWLYTGEIDLSTGKDEASMPVYDTDMDKDRYHEICLELVDCFCLGDMLIDSGFCNVVNDEFIRLCEGIDALPDVEYIKEIWSKSPKDSTLAKLLVDYVSTDLATGVFLENVDKYPTDFMVKIAEACMRYRDEDKAQIVPRNRSKCFYHEHQIGEDLCS